MEKPTKLDGNELKILGRMIELSEMNEPQITKDDLQHAVGIWDVKGEHRPFGRGYKVRPSGDSTFTSSLNRLINLGLVEQIKLAQPTEGVVLQLPSAKKS